VSDACEKNNDHEVLFYAVEGGIYHGISSALRESGGEAVAAATEQAFGWAAWKSIGPPTQNLIENAMYILVSKYLFVRYLPGMDLTSRAPKWGTTYPAREQEVGLMSWQALQSLTSDLQHKTLKLLTRLVALINN
jgi:hypothetical protein